MDNRKYTKDHFWVSFDGDTAKIGITDYAQENLGDILFVNLAEEGDEVDFGDEVASIESGKQISSITSMVKGTITKVNEVLLDEPEKVNEDPYGSYLVEIACTEVDEDQCISEEEYQDYIESL